MSTKLDHLLSEAAERIRREAYLAGWRDAMAAVTKAVAQTADVKPLKNGTNIGLNLLAAARPDAVVRGSAPWYVLQAIRKRAGMTGSEIIGFIHEGGHKVSGAAVRTALMRLGRKKLIVARNKKWFPA